MQINFDEDFKKKFFYFLFIGFIIINIILIFSLRLLPFIDLPQHLAYATIYKYIGEPGNAFDEFFEFDSLVLKYNTFHVFFTSLDIWNSVELGNKIFFALYIILLPVSVLIFIKKLDGNYWVSLLSFIFLYNFNVSWGFVGFMMAIPFCFLALIFHYDYINRTSLKSIVFLILLFFMIYHIHLLSALYILGLFVMQHLFFNKNSMKKIFLKGFIYIPFIILILWGVFVNSQGSTSGQVEKSLIERIIFYYKTEFFLSLKYRFGGVFFWDNFFLFKGIKGIVTGIFFSMFTIISLFFPLKSKIRLLKMNIQQKRISFAASICIYSLLVYLFIFSNGLIFFRFSVYIFLSLIILGSLLYKRKLLRPQYFLIPVICLLYIILWSDYIIKFQQENKHLNKNFFKGLPKDRVLSGLIYESDYRGKDIYIHFPDYYITWHKGIETSHIINSYPNYRLKRKVEYKELPHSYVWISKTKDYQGNFDNMDYLLIKGKYPEQDKMEINKNFNILRQSGDWILMINRSYIQ